MERLDAEQRIDFDSPTPDPLLHIDYVWTKGPGRMFGVMVCRRADNSTGDVHGFDGAEAGAEDAGELVVLKAFSGQMTNYWHVPGWVGPVAGIINTTPLYQHYRTLTEAHSARLASLDLALHHHHHHHQLQASPDSSSNSSSHHTKKQNRERRQQQQHRQRKQAQGQQRAARGSDRSETESGAEAQAQAFLERQRALLRSRRKALSRELLARIQASYRVRSFGGRELRLLQVYDDAVHRRRRSGDSGESAAAAAAAAGRSMHGGPQHGPPQGPPLAFPAGTGDCCAPKLLWAAVQRGLTPLGMVEFWYGSPPNTATAQGRRNSSGVNGGGGGGGGDGGVAAAAAAGTRVHGEMYGMCDKCELILGSMLCGQGHVLTGFDFVD
ncbi:hypothetical protein PLESTB_000768100 [Pleodorina starrii]|uniref:Uncharacterized protein n=1 Tax=Pleodorina starrii TaxID=330485 RepID=A0A9W6F264_9CHLO|nr:hypothetical protein PLESTM_000437100 [Pleodorina starrii]GLC53607.1 hypothetical protein PLESTB_000768100 [Pleodorina starrii]GLC65697.1 hypothetical protein PLESTF_000330200 [Pleodorina starrii]